MLTPLDSCLCFHKHVDSLPFLVKKMVDPSGIQTGALIWQSLAVTELNQ
jgi:hypothetical protein